MIKSRLSRRRLIGAATAGVALTGPSAPTPTRAQGDATTPEFLGPPAPQEFSPETNWPFENYDLSATRDAQGTSISAATVGRLGLAWTMPMEIRGQFGSFTANPTIVGDTIFIQDARANIYALHKETGERLWTNEYDDDVPFGGPNGIANAYGLLFTTLGGAGDVLALRPGTGKQVWRTNIRGPFGEGITTAPLVHDNRVFVSTIPATSRRYYEGGFRGVIHALEAATGRLLWWWDTTTDNLWGQPTVNSGGGFWHPPSVDDEGKLYIPIANPAPNPGAEGWPWASSRPGPNLYTNSILKMDAETATLDWYYQVLPHDIFNLDNQLTPILAEVEGRKVVFTSGKHGGVVCLDRASGKPIWRTRVGTHKNDRRTDFEGVTEDDTIEVWPGGFGGVETQFAYSAEHNVLVCPVVELGIVYPGAGFGQARSYDLFGGTGLLVALNPVDGSKIWQNELPTPQYAAATITNDIVFSAGIDGVILGFRLDNGSEVFRYQATAGINAPPAVSGDFIYFPAGGPLKPSANTTNPPPELVEQVIALSLGSEDRASPEPPVGDATPAA